MELMWSTVSMTVSWLAHILIEFSIFIAVDSVVKASLHSSRDPFERRRMWFLEALVVLCFATLMSQYDRVPYFLYILGFTTVVSALLHDRVDWRNLLSSSVVDREDVLYSNVKNGMLSSINYSNRSTQSGSFQNNNYVVPAYNSKGQIRMRHHTSTTVTAGENVVKRWISYFRAICQRKSAECTPPGLPNKGMNLCFLNTIVQCLAHVQSHGDLDEILSGMSDNCKELDFIDSYCELVAGCTMRQDSWAVLDTFAFRKAASGLCPGLIVDPKSIRKQTQQDAAEFLTWLLTTLHNVSKTVSSTRCNASNFQTSTGVENCSENERQALQDECRMLLQAAQSMYDERCVKAVQVLSDLDWIHQQSHESSVVNELFSGQILELREDGSRVSVGIQAFNVLPVPLSGPRQVSGVVYLQDCISDMCALTDVLVESPVRSFASPPTKHQTDVGNIANGARVLNPKPFSPSVSSSTPAKPEILTCGTQSPDGIGSKEFRCQTSLRYLPKCLILQLNRFNQYGHKAKTPVNIPPHGLNLTPALYDQQVGDVPPSVGPTYLYDLAALCVHEGAESTCYGHYVAFCMTTNGNWYRMDDEIVSKVNMAFECNTPLVRENAYLLFYVRRN